MGCLLNERENERKREMELSEVVLLLSFLCTLLGSSVKVVEVQKMADADSIILLVDGTFRGGDHRKWSRVWGPNRTFVQLYAVCTRGFGK